MVLDKIVLQPIEESVQKVQMEDPEYFALDAISNSKLKLLNPSEGGSPSHFFTERASEHSSSMELGSAVHQLLLEREKYFLSDFEKPGGKVGYIFKTVYDLTTRESNPLEFDDALEVACKLHDYYSSSLTEKRLETLKEKGTPYLNFLKEESRPEIIVLTSDQRMKCIRCVSSIKENKYAYDLLYPDTLNEDILTFNEDVILMDMKGIIPDSESGIDDEIILKMKCKIDNWSVDTDKNIITLNDLKTTGKPIQFFPGRYAEHKDITPGSDTMEKTFVEGSFQHYHYYRQMAKDMALVLEIV